MTFERADEILDEVIEEIPTEFYQGLSGGVNLSRFVKLSPYAMRNDLYILGQYHRGGGLGRFITIYYGSLDRLYRDKKDEVWKGKLREVLRHELMHHLESLAGEKDLEKKDREDMMSYLNRKNRTGLEKK